MRTGLAPTMASARPAAPAFFAFPFVPSLPAAGHPPPRSLAMPFPPLRPHPLVRALCIAGAIGLAASAHAETVQFDLGATASRVGTATSAPGAGATALYLDQFTLHVTVDAVSGSLPVPTFSMARTGSTPTPLLASGSDTSQGVLGLSADRRSLLLGGQDAASGTPTLAHWNSAAAAQGQLVDASTPTRFDHGTELRGSWADGSGGYYSALQTARGGGIVRGSFSDPAATPVWLNGEGMNTDVRQLQASAVYGNGSPSTGLFYSAGSASGGTAGVYQLGSDGLPTHAGTASTLLAATRDGATPNGFFFADLSLDQPGADTLYIGTEGDGIEKFSLVSDANGQSQWVFSGALGHTVVYKQGLNWVTDTLSVIGLDGVGEPGYSVSTGSGETLSVPALAMGLATVQHHVVVRNLQGDVVSESIGSELAAFADLSGYNQAMTGQAFVQTLVGGDDLLNQRLLGVAVNTPLPVVPEPASSALWLLGLGLAGLRRLRGTR